MDNVIPIEVVYATRTLAEVLTKVKSRKKRASKQREAKERLERNNVLLRNLGLLKPKTT